MERKSSDVPCSSVKIQKINLPVLGTSLHLDNVTLSVIHLIFNAYSINFDLLSSVKKESCYTDTSFVSTASKRVFESYLYTFDLVR